MNTPLRTFLVIACWSLLASTLGWAQQGERSKFDHLTTGFELIGEHRDAACESCHVKARFKGTPHDCVACQARQSYSLH
jgi:hypothetical protein